MNKTIYLRDEEGPIWERARELAADKLSPVIVSALKQFIATKEGEAMGYERVVLSFDDAEDHFLPKRKAFQGKWVLPLNDPYEMQMSQYYRPEEDSTTDYCAVAVTAKGNAVFYSWTEGPEENRYCFRVAIFPSLESAAAEERFNGTARAAIERLGVPIEELDI